MYSSKRNRMKILWIINIVLPEALRLLGEGNSLKATGGWLVGGAEMLSKSDVQLFIASPTNLVKDVVFLRGEKIGYYLFPMGKGNTHKNPEYKKFWRKIHDELNPDVVHIHGTEYSHGLEYINECGSEKVVVSIQGLTSAYYYYYYGISTFEVLRHITIRDLIRGTLFQEKERFQKRGEYEKEMIRKVHHVIGRTSWDRAHVWAINPQAKYHFCNETLRAEFYNGDTWNYQDCSPHSIFVSQATYPIKGLHMLLRAMPLILRHYPDTIIRVAGMDVTRGKEGLKGSLKLSGYGSIIKSLIKKCDLTDKVSFLGNLDADKMKSEYLRANVFLCPSTIENSPNSIGEAQILGTPVVASYVGGVSDMMKGNEENIYRFSEVDMLAYKICTVFDKQDVQISMRKVAAERHDRQKNLETTVDIYKRVLGV